MSDPFFSTILHWDREPVWDPLVDLARDCRADDESPSFHPVEFMYMGCVEGESTRLTIHLYKHIDSRRYLNLDESGIAYQYLGGPSQDQGQTISGGFYRRHRSLADALKHAGFWMFDEIGLYRSHAPDTWPGH